MTDNCSYYEEQYHILHDRVRKLQIEMDEKDKIIQYYKSLIEKLVPEHKLVEEVVIKR